MITLYGLKNCDSCRKAGKSLTAEGLDFQFVDVRTTPPAAEKILGWCDQAGFETVLNRRGRMWRTLTDDQRSDLDQDKAVALMFAHPLLIKRPVIEGGRELVVGFSPAVQQNCASVFAGLAGN